MKRLKLVLSIIVLVFISLMLVVCEDEKINNGEENNGDDFDFDFDGSEEWVSGGAPVGFYYHLGNEPNVIGQEIYYFGDSYVEYYRLDKFIDTEYGKIASLVLQYSYLIESFDNESGFWWRFVPRSKSIDKKVVDDCILKYDIEIDDKFYLFIDKRLVKTKGYNNEIWFTDETWISGTGDYEGPELVSDVPECVFTKGDLLLLVNEYISGFDSEEKKVLFVEEISEGFFEENKGGVSIFDKIWKVNDKRDGRISVDLFWRKNEVGLIDEFSLLDTVYVDDIFSAIRNQLSVIYGISIRQKLSLNVRDLSVAFINGNLVLYDEVLLIK